MMNGWKSLFFSLLLVFCSSDVFAQMLGVNEGQALGARRQLNRALSKQSAGSSFNQGLPNREMQGVDLGGLLSEKGSANTAMSGAMGYQIHVLGQVNAPGTLRVPPSTRLDEALMLAGGTGGKGSSRRVELRRGGATNYYDLLKYRSAGDLKQNPFLLDNDVIFVPFSQKNVAINGPVKVSGGYELLPTETNLLSLVHLAGGYTAGVSKSEDLTVIRYVDGKKTISKVPNIQQSLEDFELQDGDIVVVPHIMTEGRHFDYDVGSLPADNVFYPSFNDNVFVLGAVTLPGAYGFNPHYSVSDFVSLAGPVKEARLNGLRVLSSDGKKISGKSLKSYKINPGDTIVVPARAWTADNVLKWYNTIAQSIFTGVALKSLWNN